MAKNNLYAMEQNLRSIAKKYKTVKYSIGLVILFLMMGLNAFSQDVMTTEEIAASRETLKNSVGNLQDKINTARRENQKEINGLRLELIQLMEQGNQVVKSPWASWQFGANYMYNDWRGTYKGRGDKKEKYPYEGIYTRNSDIFLRNVSPDSELYEQYISTAVDKAAYSSISSTIKQRGGRTSYGLASNNNNQEPIASIELGASVKPKNISKSPITVTPPSITVNPVTPLNTPEPPLPPQLPRIEIETFKPARPEPITVNLPTPPTFNIKLGSFCNYMLNCQGGTNGGAHSGTPQSFDHAHDISITTQLTNGSPAVRYAWTTSAPFNGALLKVYFDYGYMGNITGGGTATVNTDLTIDSIRGGIQPDPSVNGAYNTGMFLTGGSRVATLDNAFNARILNAKTINMMGPLVVGYEAQSDKSFNPNNGTRSLENEGIITDAIEKSDQTDDARLNSLLKVKQVYSNGTGIHGYNPNSDGAGTVEDTTLTLPPFAGGGALGITRDPDIGYKDANGNFVITKHGGYTGYKIGLILTYEQTDNRTTSNYILKNTGTIDFKGRNSIGIQVYAPGSDANGINAPIVNVKNEGANSKITLGGVASYGLKLSSRVDATSKVENEGTIEITGDNTATYKQDNNPATSRTHLYDANGNSLSSGIAILEDGNLTGNASIRAYTGKVLNKGNINISGGKGNTGMVLINKANDNITNETTGNISVTGSENIGMRADLGTVATDDTATRLLPTAINKGTISITDGNQNIGMVANNSNGTTTVGTETVMKDRAVAKNEAGAKILFNGVSEKGIGLFAEKGGEIINSGEIKGNNTTILEETIGMVIQPKNGTLVANGTNTGTIELEGKKVTGVYNQGVFDMTAGSITTSGEKSISLYANNGATTKILKGSITAKNAALGLFADNTTIELGASTGTDAPTLNASGKGTLLFYNYTNTNPSGKFKLNQNVIAKVTGGATAFYYKDSATQALISQRLNDMFDDTGASASGKKVTVKLDEPSTLFVLENTTPSSTVINLSSANLASINAYLGNRVEIDPTSGAFKAYKVTKGRLSVDENVNLDNHTGATKSNYYRVEFLNSAVTVEAGKKMSGTDATLIKQAIAQANYAGATGTSNIDVINDGEIEFSKKGGTAIAVDYGQATNNGKITMNAANGVGENSIGLFGASSSKLKNSGTGEIYLGTKGVGIWGANKIASSVATWNKNIDIINAGKIEGIAGKEGVFGIYAVNDTTAYSTATSTINHSGIINLSQNKKSVGIYMTNGDLTSTGAISVNEESVGVDATNSNVTINGGDYTVGKESVGFKLTNVPTTKSFLGNSGNLSITDTGSVAYLISGSNFESGVNFTDNLTLTSTDPYTYMNVENSTLKYENTKTIANDDSIFINAAGSNVTLKSANDISSTNKTITGVYSTRSTVKNEGKISLTGDGSSALYAEGSTVSNESTGKITIGKEGSGIYVKSITTAPVAAASGTNYGEITIGEASVGMRAEDATVINETTGKITSTAEKATGMSQSGGSQDITNKGIITLTGDKSTALHSEGITTAGHKVINTGDITVGDSSNELTPSVGIYSANGTNSTVESSGKVIAGNKSTAIYAGNVNLTGNSETKAGDGGIGVYSREGNVNISANSEITVGATLGNGKEGVGVYLAGNNQVLNSDTNKLNIGQGSFGYVMTGQGNNVKTGLAGATGEVTLSDDSVYMYSADKTGIARNYANVKSTGNENYGIYALGAVENYGNIDFSNGIGNVGAYSYVESATSTPNAIKNYGVISVSKSDLRTNPNDKKYGIGMAAGFSEEVPVGSGTYVTRGLGNIENHGTIKVTDPDSIGMYATGAGSKIVNAGTIELSGPKRNIGIFAEHGAEVINTGTITTVGTGNVGQIGVAIRKGATLNNTGTIHIDASKGYGAFVAGGIIINRGTITVSGGATAVKEITAADTSKEMQDTQGNMNTIKINAPAGVAEATIVANGVVQTPTVVHVQAIPNRKPNDIPTSSLGMYIDTSGINYTRPITNIGALAGLTEADLIIGTEATQYTTSKYIQLGQDIIDPYNDMIRASGIEKWSIYSGSLTWMASITQLPDYAIRNAYLAKIPYTVFAGNQATPVDKKDTYNFLDGLEQRYGIEAIGTRENKVFQKLNTIGNNEEILFHQATDEMMGHQYANVQQRIQATGDILNKEFNYLRSKWQTASKDSNKIKTFGTRGEYKTDTAGVIDYKNHAYGVAYVHEDETVRLGEGTGWYAGIVHNTFKFKDIGNSREEMIQGKVGIFKSVPFDENNSLNWTISGDISVGYNKMHRRFLVVDEVFHAKGRYRTYGIGIKNEISKDFRLSESFNLKPYVALGLEYGRFSKIKERSGEIRLDVKSNDYFSIRPEIGAELGFKQYFGRKTLRVGVSVAYQNELGRVANGKNKARVAYTTADWFNIRGEKEDRRGNVKTDLNIGVDNQRIGLTGNIGYDTKGHNIRGGVGLRVIF